MRLCMLLLLLVVVVVVCLAQQGLACTSRVQTEMLTAISAGQHPGT
jgi:hypothetical protein